MIVSMWMTKNPVTVGVRDVDRGGRGADGAPAYPAPARHGRSRPADARRHPVRDRHPAAFPPDVNPLATANGCPAEHRAVEEIMRRAPLTTAPDEPVEEVARIMATRRSARCRCCAKSTRRNDHRVGHLSRVRQRVRHRFLRRADHVRRVAAAKTSSYVARLAAEHRVRVVSDEFIRSERFARVRRSDHRTGVDAVLDDCGNRPPRAQRAGR